MSTLASFQFPIWAHWLLLHFLYELIGFFYWATLARLLSALLTRLLLWLFARHSMLIYSLPVSSVCTHLYCNKGTSTLLHYKPEQGQYHRTADDGLHKYKLIIYLSKVTSLQRSRTVWPVTSWVWTQSTILKIVQFITKNCPTL